MRVTLIARTELTTGAYEAFRRLGFVGEAAIEAQDLAEFAGRLCYKSFNKPNPATASNRSYIKNLIDHKHFSVLEHASATFLFEGVSRNLTHELVRHRHFSFSQVSQRYVDDSDTLPVFPEAVVGLWNDRPELRDRIARHVIEAQAIYSEIADQMAEGGAKRKAAQQAARFILPGSTETSIVVSGNHRSWREFLDKRYSVHADPEIRTLAGEVLDIMKWNFPDIYQDFEIKEF